MAAVGGYDQTQGWRYVVLMSKFFYQFIQHGFLYSFGVMIPSMVEQLNCSYSVAGFISTLFHTSTWVFCPVAHLLSTKFGCRKTSVVGGSVVCVCVSCLFFVRMPALVGLLLLVAGICNSFVAQTGYVVLQENFGEQFGAANAVASFGFSFGALTFPLLSHILLKTYGIGGTFLIFGGMTAHFIPIGATFRSPRPAASGRVDDSNLPMSPDIEGSGGPSDFLTGESRSREAHMEDLKDTTFQHLSTDGRKDCAYQVLRREVEIDEGETEIKNTKEQEKEADEHIEAMSSITSSSSCLSIYRFFKSVCVLIVKTLALDDLWQEKEFTLFLIPCQLLADMISAGWSLFVITYGLSVGIDPDTARYLLFAGVVGGFLSRGLSVILLRVHHEKALGLYAFFYVVLISGLFSYPLYSSSAYLIFCSTLTGFGIFGIYTTFYAVLNVSVSGDHFSGILAATFCIFGVMMSFSSIIAGRIFDITQSLKTMFMIYGGFGCVGAILIFTFVYRRRRNTSSSI